MRKEPRKPLTVIPVQEEQPKIYRKVKKTKNPIVDSNPRKNPPNDEKEKGKNKLSRDDVIEKDFELKESQVTIMEQILVAITDQNALLVEIKTILQNQHA